MRPVDALPAPESFAYERWHAIVLSRCAKCGGDVVTYELSEEDLREYVISALCPACSVLVFVEDPDEEDCE